MAMKKGKNLNHPKSGSSTKVEPIKSVKDIKAVKKLLEGNPLHHCLFTIGINTNLRAVDLLSITAGQVRNLKPMDEITLREKKTGKSRRISLNKACIDSIQKLFTSRQYSDSEALFTGQRGALTVPTVSQLVKKWCATINLSGGNYAAHTLRKTWGYHQRVTFGMGLPELMVCFNHSTQRQTLEYLCIQPDEIKNVYSNEL
jgi:integrase